MVARVPRGALAHVDCGRRIRLAPYRQPRGRYVNRLARDLGAGQDVEDALGDAEVVLVEYERSPDRPGSGPLLHRPAVAVARKPHRAVRLERRPRVDEKRHVTLRRDVAGERECPLSRRDPDAPLLVAVPGAVEVERTARNRVDAVAGERERIEIRRARMRDRDGLGERGQIGDVGVGLPARHRLVLPVRGVAPCAVRRLVPGIAAREEATRQSRTQQEGKRLCSVHVQPSFPNFTFSNINAHIISPPHIRQRKIPSLRNASLNSGV